MTSRRDRQLRRENSPAGLLRQIREDDWTKGPDAMNTAERRPSFTCPDCKVTTYHPEDVKHSYCGTKCHQFKCDQWMTPRCMEPSCPDFGDYDFGEGTCPDYHALPPAWRTT